MLKESRVFVQGKDGLPNFLDYKSVSDLIPQCASLTSQLYTAFNTPGEGGATLAEQLIKIRERDFLDIQGAAFESLFPNGAVISDTNKSRSRMFSSAIVPPSSLNRYSLESARGQRSWSVFPTSTQKQPKESDFWDEIQAMSELCASIDPEHQILGEKTIRSGAKPAVQ